MKSPDNLQRWNRGGLTRFRYVNGNAATYLERLRELMSDRFPDWESMQNPNTDDENDNQRLKRMLDQYHGNRGDWGQEILRTFSRAVHILTEHVDAYANEGFLGTSVQWENLRRLVEMLDYHPAPPASASTPVFLNIKEGLSGQLKKGFQVKHTPTDGGEAVVYESLEDVSVDSRLNELYVSGYGKSPEVLDGKTSLTLENSVDGLLIGQPVILENEEGGGAFRNSHNGCRNNQRKNRGSFRRSRSRVRGIYTGQYDRSSAARRKNSGSGAHNHGKERMVYGRLPSPG